MGRWVGLIVAAVPGVIIFGHGSPAWYITCAIGFFIGAAFERKKPPSAVEEQAVSRSPGTTLKPDVAELSEDAEQAEADEFSTPSGDEQTEDGEPTEPSKPRRSGWIPLAVLIAIVVAVPSSIALVVALQKTPAPIGVPIAPRPAVAAEYWDAFECVERAFPQSVLYAVPPDIYLFCSHPWNAAVIRKLVSALVKVGLGPTDGYSQSMAEAVSGMIPSGDLLDFLLVKEFLPLAKFPAGLEAVKSRLKPGVPDQIKQLARLVSWGDDPTMDALHRFHLGAHMTITTDQFDLETVDQLAVALLNYPLTVNTLTAAMGPGAAAIADWRGILLPPEQGAAILALQLDVIVGEVASQSLTYETAWKEMSASDYEVFYTDALDHWPCGGSTVDDQRAALYCPQDHRLYVSVAALQAVGDLYPKIEGLTVMGYPAALYHELAHVLYDAVDHDFQPFIAEGRATAQGERLLQAVLAASTHLDTSSLSVDSKHFLDVFVDPSAPSPSNADNQLVEDIVNKAPFTAFQMRALCFLAQTKTTADYVVHELELPLFHFNGQSKAELDRSYYVAWSLFHYADEATGAARIDSRLDPSPLRLAADLVSKNETIEGEAMTGLNSYLDQVQTRLALDIQKVMPKCRP